MAGTALTDAMRARDAQAIAALLADDVTFDSPVTSYSGRDDVAHVLATVARVIDDLTGLRTIEGPGEAVAFVGARIAGAPADGVLDQAFDDDGRIAHVTLLLRPLDVLVAGVRRMGAALEAEPLPSARRG